MIGAHAAGMPVVWFNHRRRVRPEGPVPEREVWAATEIPAAIEAVALV